MTPIFSGVCRSTNSEGVKIYTGNGHTTTKISAGMVFLSHGVIAAVRFKTKTTENLNEGSILRLKKNITLLNKIGKLLKDEPELLLKSGELILCIVGIYHLLNGRNSHGSPINLSDVRLICHMTILKGIERR
jgi:hypothetical protein